MQFTVMYMIIVYNQRCQITPTKQSNTQLLVNLKIQMLWEENPKLVNVMQYNRNSDVGSINTVRKYSHYVIFTFPVID